mmetsp:Transcript_11597/g.27254  ORF Transcript_11597/g.27254 Transcript_11597/m.27254 type:complete len:235 (+) Transcript_11597:631-1335(+)
MRPHRLRGGLPEQLGGVPLGPAARSASPLGGAQALDGRDALPPPASTIPQRLRQAPPKPRRLPLHTGDAAAGAAGHLLGEGAVAGLPAFVEAVPRPKAPARSRRPPAAPPDAPSATPCGPPQRQAPTRPLRHPAAGPAAAAAPGSAPPRSWGGGLFEPRNERAARHLDPNIPRLCFWKQEGSRLLLQTQGNHYKRRGASFTYSCGDPPLPPRWEIWHLQLAGKPKTASSRASLI